MGRRGRADGGDAHQARHRGARAILIAAFVAAVIIGGTNFVAVRYSNDELAPFWGAALRFGLASALFFGVVALRREALPRGSTLGGVMAFGALAFGGAYALAYWGLVDAPAGIAGVFIAASPLLTVFAAALHGLERVTWRAVGGAAIALAGVATISIDQLGAQVPLLSILALLATVVCIAESTVLAKLTVRAGPAATNAIGMATGTVILLVLALVAGERIALPTAPAPTLALLYLATVGSVGLFAAFLFVIRRWTASASAYAVVFMPLVTTPLAAVMRGESVGPTFGLGMALVLVGVYVGALARPGHGLPFRRRAARPQGVEGG